MGKWVPVILQLSHLLDTTGVNLSNMASKKAKENMDSFARSYAEALKVRPSICIYIYCVGHLFRFYSGALESEVTQEL